MSTIRNSSDAAICAAIAVTQSSSWPEWIDLSYQDRWAVMNTLMDATSTEFNLDVAELDWFKASAFNGSASEWRLKHRLANQQINEAVIKILTRVEQGVDDD